MEWEKNVGNNLFSENITNLWEPEKLPPLFINITRVENGMPFVLSGLKLKSDIIKDLYKYLPDNTGLKISSGSLLSARFPYVGPAGIIGDIGLVDGGYFDNTGANTAFETLMRLYESNLYNYRNNKPIIVYIKNGSDTKDITGSPKSLLYQLTAPIATTMQLRDSNTKNNLQRVKELVKFLGGDFYTFSLADSSEYTPEIPLGWALSETTQDDINIRVDEIINSQEFDNLKNAL